MGSILNYEQYNYDDLYFYIIINIVALFWYRKKIAGDIEVTRLTRLRKDSF